VKGINREIKAVYRATLLNTINMVGTLVKSILYPIIGLLIIWDLKISFFLFGMILMVLIGISRVEN
jgi:hypothetical protein